MNLAAEARAAARRGGSRCTVAVLFDTYPDPNELREAIEDLSVPGEALAAVLRGRGYPMQGQTLQRHRRGVCSCEGE